jgi:thiamine biosynthesis lipoprotein|tara:strand:+ start:1227 stop:2255 length:1029 start_codon:yes stop_codon:yes gene_type:complete
MNYNNTSKGRAICLFFMLVGFVACKQETTIQQNKVSGNALGTTYHIVYLSTAIDSIRQKIDSMVFAVNHGLSTYQDNSLISAFNINSDGLWNDPNEAKHFVNDMRHFAEMVSLSKGISSKTAGAFDPSAKLLFDEYMRAKKAEEVMSTEAVAHAIAHKGMGKVLFDKQGVPYKLDSLVQLNFNAIAKGYLVDIIGNYLTAQGVNDYLVEVGGEMRLKGQNAEGVSWKVGINVPLLEAKSSDFFKVLELEDIALATSGNYQDFYSIEGKLVGHTLDPRDGKPVISTLKSASILHKKCAVADAYATAAMVLGLEESRKIVQQDSTLSAFFIYENGTELQGEFVE